MGPLPSYLRGLVGALALAGLLLGCSAWFGNLQFDRCHKAEKERETLYLEFYCRQRR